MIFEYEGGLMHSNEYWYKVKVPVLLFYKIALLMVVRYW